jgi:NAD(P)-dependent dehydrogenase (short-subunit alcohol dehydrogenase family)
MSLPKQAIFISGCDSGFGKALVGKLEALNNYVVFAGVFTEEGKIQYGGKPSVVAVPLDVTSDSSVAQARDIVQRELVKRGAVLYGLVNNAGLLTKPGPTEWQDVANYERMMAVNLYGVVRLTNLFLPMIRNSQGRIVIVASIAGRVGLAANSAYCASKYAVSGYAEVLRRDMQPWGVRVCVIEPGVYAQTGLYSDFQKGLDTTWKNLDEQMKKDYGESYYKHVRGLLGYVLKGFSNGDPSEVPAAMVDALTNPMPLRRYRVGRDSQTFFRILPLLPDHWVDGILTRSGSKPVLPAVVAKEVKGNELYSKDTTASIVASGLAGLSTVGAVSLTVLGGKLLLSKL